MWFEVEEGEKKGRTLCRGRAEEGLSQVRGPLFLVNGLFCFVLDAFVLECSSLIGLISLNFLPLDSCSCSIHYVTPSLKGNLMGLIGFYFFFTDTS